MKRLLTLLLYSFALSTPLAAQQNFTQEGQATFYADKFHGRTTASGERYDKDKFTAAHMSLPFGTVVRVTNKDNGKSVAVRINDRGPFTPNRIIDLSRAAANSIDMLANGVANVTITSVSASELQDNPSPSLEQPNNITANQPVKQHPNEPKPPAPNPFKDIPSIEYTPSPKQPGNTTNAPKKNEPALYSISIAPKPLKGYGVQIANFQNLSGLIKQIDAVDSALQKQLNVYFTSPDATSGYKLIVGPYSSRAEAEQARKKLNSAFSDCFIIAF